MRVVYLTCDICGEDSNFVSMGLVYLSVIAGASLVVARCFTCGKPLRLTYDDLVAMQLLEDFVSDEIDYF